MPELKHLKVEKDDGVARITFARPKHNVLDIEMMNELNGELEGLIADDGLKCLVIDGEGPSWCAGVEVADHKPEMAGDMIATFNRIFELVDRLEVPTIAAVHDGTYPGRIVIYPQLDMPLTDTAELAPQGCWSNEAEKKLLESAASK